VPFGTRPDTRRSAPMPITKVHHFGEGVAAVAAVDEDTAEEALDLIKVEYEELPVCSPQKMRSLRVRAGDEFSKSNVAYFSDFFSVIETGFKEADYMRERQIPARRG